MKTVTNINSNKDTYFQSQFKKIESYFRDYTATRYMAETDTGIPLQNICRYCEKLFKSNKIAVVRKAKCQQSGCDNVQYLTTNPELFPKDNQLKLWE